MNHQNENPGAFGDATGANAEIEAAKLQPKFYPANAGDASAKLATLNNRLAVWQRGRAWRKLPYARGVWDGPRGQCEYLCDRDYNAIAYRAPNGRWMPAKGQTLRGFAMIDATYTWTPGIGESPAVNFATLADLLKRCARHPSTAWLIDGEVSA